MGADPPSQGPQGRGTGTVDNVLGEVHSAMSQMRDNMKQMAERDAQINNLVSSTQNLQGASSAFHQNARQLQASYQWQQCRLYLVVTTLCTWIPVFFFRFRWLKWWAPLSLALVGTVFFLRDCLMRRREMRYSAAVQKQGYSYSPELQQTVGTIF
mmetsp:Transcript_100452/g.199448  ORF Transcript_100452/g.199448 Transcript_100452/m.199448 type:complete len:155 (+) Transcript_100452:33-497(+)